ncbi:MAG: HK97 gp10 family phage protein [Caldilineaceae bacterium SB0668_bin_21]|nr:HK97 gp10 family phage protein [Caldilineaceae bacterium SB0668_bin_21]MXX24377.1 HK97 gp10 family phage protein [Caldilineaceae bacterium SB0668_bin_21]
MTSTRAQVARVNRAIEKRIHAVRAATNAALHDAGQRILTGALEAVPVEHGDLKASGQVIRNDDGTVVVGFGNMPEGWYAQVAHRPGLEPVHYLRDAFEREKADLPARLPDDIRRHLGQ